MSAPQLGANVDEQPVAPAEIGTALHAAVERFAGTAEGDAALAQYSAQLDAMLADAPAGPALTQLPHRTEQTDAHRTTVADQLLDGDERAELGALRQLYRAGEFITPLPDVIDPDGRARWHGPDGGQGPGWLVMRYRDGRLYVDPGAPLFAPVSRQYGTAFALALLAATGPAPTTTKGAV